MYIIVKLGPNPTRSILIKAIFITWFLFMSQNVLLTQCSRLFQWKYIQYLLLLCYRLRHVTPGYWKIVTEFTHTDCLKQIKRMSNVTTDLGRGLLNSFLVSFHPVNVKLFTFDVPRTFQLSYQCSLLSIVSISPLTTPFAVKW